MCCDVAEHACIITEVVSSRLVLAGRRGAREGPRGRRGTWSYLGHEVIRSCARQERARLDEERRRREAHGMPFVELRQRAAPNDSWLILLSLTQQEEEALEKARAEEEAITGTLMHRLQQELSLNCLPGTQVRRRRARACRKN